MLYTSSFPHELGIYRWSNLNDFRHPEYLYPNCLPLMLHSSYLSEARIHLQPRCSKNSRHCGWAGLLPILGKCLWTSIHGRVPWHCDYHGWDRLLDFNLLPERDSSMLGRLYLDYNLRLSVGIWSDHCFSCDLWSNDFIYGLRSHSTYVWSFRATIPKNMDDTRYQKSRPWHSRMGCPKSTCHSPDLWRVPLGIDWSST